MNSQREALRAVLYTHPPKPTECDCCGYPGHDLPKWRKVLQDAKPTGGGVPEGWKLVPIEPTDEIKSAIRNAVDAAYLALLEGVEGEASDWALQSYRAALLAARQPED